MFWHAVYCKPEKNNKNRVADSFFFYGGVKISGAKYPVGIENPRPIWRIMKPYKINIAESCFIKMKNKWRP